MSLKMLAFAKLNRARFYADIENVIEPVDIIMIVFLSKCLFTRN